MLTNGRPFRIAFIGGRGVGAYYSGIETFYEEVGSRLAERGHVVTAYCRRSFTPSMESYRGILIRRLPAIPTKHLETLSHSFLSTIVAAFSDHDIVHIHAIGSAVFSWLPRVTGRRTVVTIHGIDWQRPKWKGLASLCLRAAEWASVRFPNSTVSVSQSVADHLSSVHHSSSVVVPNGVSLPAPAGASRIQALGLNSGKFVLFVGRLSEEKGCHDLIEAFQREPRPGLDLVLAGGATYTDPYEDRIRLLGGPQVRFLGWVDQPTLAELYAHCAVFVLPSSIEGLSVALLEAMSHGAAALVSDIAPNVEALGDAGWFFRRGDVSHLADRLSTLLGNEDLRRCLGAAARARVAEHFSWDAVVLGLERVYAGVVHPGARGPQ